MMVRSGLKRMQVHSETVMVGDLMATDVVAGTEAGLDTMLVFTGSTTVAAVDEYSYRPGRVLPPFAEAIDLILRRGQSRSNRVMCRGRSFDAHCPVRHLSCGCLVSAGGHCDSTTA